MDEPITSSIDNDVEYTVDDDEGLKYVCTPHWVKSFNSKEVRGIRVLLEHFMEQFLNVNGFLPGVSQIFVHILQSYGVEITCETKSHIRKIDSISIRKTRESSNLDNLMRKISNAIKELNTTHFLKNELLKTGTTIHTRALTFPSSRLDMYYLSNNGYLTGLELKLSSVNFLRELASLKRVGEYQDLTVYHSRYDRLISTLMVHYTFSALQTVLMHQSSTLNFVGEQIVQLAHSHIVKMRHLTFESDILGHLNEAFLCCLALDLKIHQEELSNMEGVIRNKSSKFFIPWNAWNIVSRYERNIDLGSPSSFLIDATRLAETLTDEEIGEKSVVFVEEACKIWKNCNHYEHEILAIITEFTKLYPQNGPRMLELAKFCDISYEIDSLIEDMCGRDENKLHPADETWLKWIERRLNNINRFGDIESNILKCLTAIFNFLDFDSNKCSQKAWELIHKIVQMAHPRMVEEEWRSRRKWWPRFHRNFYDFNLKTEVLDALEELNHS